MNRPRFKVEMRVSLLPNLSSELLKQEKIFQRKHKKTIYAQGQIKAGPEMRIS